MKKSLNALVEDFAENVRAQNIAIGQGDSAKGNKHAKRYLSAFQKLRAMGDQGREALSLLLNDDRPDVRAMAACFLLRYKNSESMEVLRQVSKMKNLVGFGARECIKRWNEGNWSLDPEN